METKTCRFCAEEIQAAAVVCKHCGNLVVDADLETLARTWGDYTEPRRRAIWEGLSSAHQQVLRTTLEYLRRQAPQQEASTAATSAVALATTTIACPHCTKQNDVDAAACTSCGRLLLSAELEYVARGWSGFSKTLRDEWWQRLTPEERPLVERAIAHVTRNPHSFKPLAAPGKRKANPVAWGCLVLVILGFLGLVLSDPTPKARPAAAARASTPAPRPDTGRATDSVYEQDITRATTSSNLSNSDIAWHALNTYGWDCEQVVSRGPARAGYFTVTCSSGKVLRVYPRAGQHPRVTNETGGYD